MAVAQISGLLTERSGRIYLPQIDGIRFLAFLLVYVSHAPEAFDYMERGTLHAEFLHEVRKFGWIGVDIFLVVSSFLIVTLLLAEQARTGTISLSRFYIRRVLRIWPLYFPYAVLGILVLPPLFGATPLEQDKTVREHLLPFMTFFGNFSYGYFTDSLSGFFAHLWTINLEEQYYMVAPILMLLLGRSAVSVALYLAILAWGLSVGYRAYLFTNGVPFEIVWAFPISRLDPFVVGGLCAVLIRFRSDLIHQLPGYAYAALSLIFFLGLSLAPKIENSWHVVWQLAAAAMGAGCLVIALCYYQPLAIAFSSRIVTFLGKISYGLYVYHMMILLALARLDEVYGLFPSSSLGWLTYFLTGLTAVVLLSAISYLYYERVFLRLKARFELVQSRPA